MNKKYKPGDSVNFFKNTINPQRTHGVIIEQVTEKQYKPTHQSGYSKHTPGHFTGHRGEP